MGSPSISGASMPNQQGHSGSAEGGSKGITISAPVAFLFALLVLALIVVLLFALFREPAPAPQTPSGDVPTEVQDAPNPE